MRSSIILVAAVVISIATIIVGTTHVSTAASLENGISATPTPKAKVSASAAASPLPKATPVANASPVAKTTPIAKTTAVVKASPAKVLPARTNFALLSNGAVATASSIIFDKMPGYPVFSADSAFDGDRTGRKWGHGGGWNDETSTVFPDWLQSDFSGPKTIDEIDVITFQDDNVPPVEPSATMKFTRSGIKDFIVQYWKGTAWVTVPGGNVTGNDLIIRTFKFTPVSTTKIRITVNAALQAHSRIVEFEAWGKK